MSPINETRKFISIDIAVLTVSDTRSLSDDKSGDTLEKLIIESGHRLFARTIVNDDSHAIRKQVQQWVDNEAINIIITTGGTGFTGRDVTPDAIEPMFEKKMEGFSTCFHNISFAKIGTSTMQSRVMAGLVNRTFIFVLPGSPNACKDAWLGILQYQLDNRYRPCNLIEIIPRLSEH